MNAAATMIPPALLDFLNEQGGRMIEFDRSRQPQMEVSRCSFLRPEDLRVRTFEIETLEFYLNHNEPGENPRLCYPVEGIDLIGECDNYDAAGILVYFPCLGEFGSWDCDHRIIEVFPGKEWPRIEQALAAHVNAQWDPHLAEIALLRPWSDPRCASVQPHPTEY